MAKSATIDAAPRHETGKGPARAARRSGRIPAVLYGHGEASVPLTVDAHSFERLLHQVSIENTLIDLELSGQSPMKVLVREVQRHPYRDAILHVDFFHISMQEKISVEVPVVLVGTAKGVRLHGGIQDHAMREIEVLCLPSDIPEKIEVDVSQLEIGDSVRVADLQVPNVQVLADAEQAVVSIVPPTVIEEVVPEAAAVVEGAEPEVIAAKGKEEEGETAPAKGEKSEKGEKGAKAERGEKGAKAERGEKGERGEKK